MGAVPLAGAIAQLSWIKGHPIAAFFVRKKPKEHGARLAVEGLAKGETLQGKRIVIVEDVTTTGGSAIKAVEAVRDAGGEVALVFTMVDREEGADETFAAGRDAVPLAVQGGRIPEGVIRALSRIRASSPAMRGESVAQRCASDFFPPPQPRSPLVYHPASKVDPTEADDALRRVGRVGWSWRCVQSWPFRAGGAA